MHEQLIVANAFTPVAQAIIKSLRNLDKKKKKVKPATPLVVPRTSFSRYKLFSHIFIVNGDLVTGELLKKYI